MRPGRLSAVVLFLAIVGVIRVPSGSAAQAPNAEDVAEGMRLYRQKGDCQACHGWAADGRKMDSQMPDGANLRTTRLDRDTLITAIKCGRPGKGMPAFDRLAYSDGRCYDMKQADLKRLGSAVARPAGDAAAARDRVLADFLFAKVIGKGPMDRPRASGLGIGRRRVPGVPEIDTRPSCPPSAFAKASADRRSFTAMSIS